MTQATKTLFKRIALVFDFDDTLAPDSYRSLLESMGMDRDKFAEEQVQPLAKAGWDPMLARFYCLIKEAQRREDVTLSADYLHEVGSEMPFFDGVPEMFERVRARAKELVPDIEVEFCLLSSGVLEIAQGTSIADEFDKMWGCEFHYNEQGEIDFVKRLITHPEKVRYLLQFAKGLSDDSRTGRPEDIYRDIPEEEWHIPLSQVIYVGDGASDMPVFRLMREHRGIAIGVFKSDKVEDWSYYEKMHAGRRFENLAPADYRDDSEMMQSLLLATEAICKQIALTQLSENE